jgi:hypothetical protein
MPSSHMQRSGVFPSFQRAMRTGDRAKDAPPARGSGNNAGSFSAVLVLLRVLSKQPFVVLALFADVHPLHHRVTDGMSLPSPGWNDGSVAIAPGTEGRIVSAGHMPTAQAPGAPASDVTTGNWFIKGAGSPRMAPMHPALLPSVFPVVGRIQSLSSLLSQRHCIGIHLRISCRYRQISQVIGHNAGSVHGLAIQPDRALEICKRSSEGVIAFPIERSGRPLTRGRTVGHRRAFRGQQIAEHQPPHVVAALNIMNRDWFIATFRAQPLGLWFVEKEEEQSA